MKALDHFCTVKNYAWILLFCLAVSEATVCQVNVTLDEKESGVSISQGDAFITCPGIDDPANYTACCYGDNTSIETQEGPWCCLPPSPIVGIFYIDDQLAMIIALSVTTICVIITIIIIICCFWSRCPLYTACRIRYHQDDIIAYASKDEETAGLNDMPPEETKGVSIYSPNAVKVTLKDDV
ncbi:uncharacterized protein [Panulirus ornatus]|uniref:uncharacterized protein n=1 Tax=Panulirus ornatus TaxID=150431 RepID=UPI003A888B51